MTLIYRRFLQINASKFLFQRLHCQSTLINFHSMLNSEFQLSKTLLMNFNIYKLRLLISSRFHTILNARSVLQQVRMISDTKTQKTHTFPQGRSVRTAESSATPWLVPTKFPAWCRTFPPTYHKSSSNCLVTFLNTSCLLQPKMGLLVPLGIILLWPIYQKAHPCPNQGPAPWEPRNHTPLGMDFRGNLN